MATQNDVLEALSTKQAAISTEDLAKELKASVEEYADNHSVSRERLRKGRQPGERLAYN